LALLALARAALEAHLAGRPLPPPCAVPGATLKRGAFVTLMERGALRGCIGHIAPDRELGLVVQDMAVAAARDDPRFAPVALEELPLLTLEISVLSEPTALPAPVDPARVVVGRDGVIVRRGKLVALLLPQVATEYQWQPEAFLAATCRKAGLPHEAWREPETCVLTFRADVFAEPGEEGQGTGDG
jgi:AmmeMemoRadiSam system protein A